MRTGVCPKQHPQRAPRLFQRRHNSQQRRGGGRRRNGGAPTLTSRSSDQAGEATLAADQTSVCKRALRLRWDMHATAGSRSSLSCSSTAGETSSGAAARADSIMVVARLAMEAGVERAAASIDRVAKLAPGGGGYLFTEYSILHSFGKHPILQYSILHEPRQNPILQYSVLQGGRQSSILHTPYSLCFAPAPPRQRR